MQNEPYNQTNNHFKTKENAYKGWKEGLVNRKKKLLRSQSARDKAKTQVRLRQNLKRKIKTGKCLFCTTSRGKKKKEKRCSLYVPKPNQSHFQLQWRYERQCPVFARSSNQILFLCAQDIATNIAVTKNLIRSDLEGWIIATSYFKEA